MLEEDATIKRSIEYHQPKPVWKLKTQKTAKLIEQNKRLKTSIEVDDFYRITP